MNAISRNSLVRRVSQEWTQGMVAVLGPASILLIVFILSVGVAAVIRAFASLEPWSWEVNLWGAALTVLAGPLAVKRRWIDRDRGA